MFPNVRDKNHLTNVIAKIEKYTENEEYKVKVNKLIEVFLD